MKISLRTFEEVLLRAPVCSTSSWRMLPPFMRLRAASMAIPDLLPVEELLLLFGDEEEAAGLLLLAAEVCKFGELCDIFGC